MTKEKTMTGEMSFDAVDWAKLFMQLKSDQGDEVARDQWVDEENMRAWFANALMRGFDEHARRAASAGGELDRIAKGHASFLLGILNCKTHPPSEATKFKTDLWSQMLGRGDLEIRVIDLVQDHMHHAYGMCPVCWRFSPLVDIRSDDKVEALKQLDKNNAGAVVDFVSVLTEPMQKCAWGCFEPLPPQNLQKQLAERIKDVLRARIR